MINLFLKDLHGLLPPGGGQTANFSEVFEDVPEDYNPTRAIPLDFSDLDSTLLDMWDSITSLSSGLDSLSEAYSSFNTYPGVIPEPYITYFSSIFLMPEYFFSDYVAFVTQEFSGSYSSTVYNFFVSPNLSFSGSSFSGSGTLYKYYSSSRFPTYVVDLEPSFSLRLGSGAVFTSLSGTPYPDFTATTLSSRYVLYALFFIILWLAAAAMFHVKRLVRHKRKEIF